MNPTVKGVLKVEQGKKYPVYKAVYTNLKGKEVTSPISQGAIFFDQGAAKDGAAITIELKPLDQMPQKVTLDGQPETGPIKPPKKPDSQNHHPSTRHGKGGGGVNQGSALPTARERNLWATAPYNFIPFDPRLIVPGAPPAAGEKTYGGIMTCRLEALTPLLVAGPQQREQKPPKRKFLEIGGCPVIPGSSLKGILRSLVEVLSFSRLYPINDGRLVFRNFDDDYYKGILPSIPPNGFKSNQGSGLAQKAGWLIKRGADYWITPVKYTRDNKSAADQVLVETGNRPRLGTPSRYYFDRAERPNGKQFSVDRELIQQFRDQLTEEQKSLLKKRGSDESLNKPVPVFYVLDEKGKVWFLGLPKYFRIPYERSPADLVGQASGLDFAAALFGTVSGKARRGRVAVGAARLEKWEPMESAVATLGQPQATCVAHYLRQDPDQLRVMKNNSGRINPKTLTTYNSDEPRLSGRKWYWHRDWAPTENPKGNENTDAELFPVKAGAEGRFNIVLDGLSLEELGAVLMALEPFPGAAHKLGMGKPLGLGSVRLTVEELRLGSERDRYVSISDRLAGRAEAEAELKSRARLAFQEHILGQLKEQGAGAASFDDLPAIKTLRVMMDYEGRPKNEATAYLSIEEPNRQGVTYKTKAPLKTPEHIKRESGRRPD